jgi:hypothetical protein
VINLEQLIYNLWVSHSWDPDSKAISFEEFSKLISGIQIANLTPEHETSILFAMFARDYNKELTFREFRNLVTFFRGAVPSWSTLCGIWNSIPKRTNGSISFFEYSDWLTGDHHGSERTITRAAIYQLPKFPADGSLDVKTCITKRSSLMGLFLSLRRVRARKHTRPRWKVP